MKKSLVGILIAALALCSLALGTRASAQNISLSDLVNLFISLGIISPDKADAARAAVNGNSTSSSSGFCHTWNSNLQFSDGDKSGRGDDVSALQQALQKEGFAVDSTEASHGMKGPGFGESTAAAVVKFQGKYGIPQTGYVGPLTRAKLNSMYGCSGNVTTPAGTVDTQAPAISYIRPTSVNAGDTVYVYGSNFNANTYIAFDGNYGRTIWPDNAPASGSGVLTFTVPTNVSSGTHTVQLAEKAASFPLSNSVSLSVGAQGSTDQYITVLSPKAGDQLIVGQKYRVEWSPMSQTETGTFSITESFDSAKTSVIGTANCSVSYTGGKGSCYFDWTPSEASTRATLSITSQNGLTGYSGVFNVSAAQTSASTGSLIVENANGDHYRAEVRPGQEMATLVTLGVTAKDSTMKLQEVKVLFGGNVADDSKAIWLKIFKEIYLTDDSGYVIAQADLNTSTVSNVNGRWTLTLKGFNYSVSQGRAERLSIKADTYSPIAASYGQTSYMLDIPASGLRAVDASGVSRYAPDSVISQYVLVTTP